MFVVLGLGSNRGFGSFDSVHLLARASFLLSGVLSNFRSSSVYRTKPMYFENQDDFLNMAVSGDWDGSPHELLSRIHEIESLLGRDRGSEIKNGPRAIDIDIELFGGEEISFHDPENPMNNLEIPHPRLSERAFVLIPLLEVLPENADIKGRDFFEKSLIKIGGQGAEICFSSSEFAEILARAGA